MLRNLFVHMHWGGVPQNVQGATEEEGSTNLILFTYITYGMALNWGIGFEVNDF